MIENKNKNAAGNAIIKLKEIADAQETTANIQKWLKEGEDFFKLNK